jgi:FkbH-like protein
VLQKLTISSSSFLLPKHPAWDLLSNKYNIDYKYIGNFSGALLSKSDDQILVNILFFSDFYDENLLNDFNPDKVNNPIIDLIKKKAEVSKQPLIFALSSWSSFNIVSSVFKKPLAEKIYLDFISRLSSLQKTYSNIYFFNLDYVFANLGFSKIFDRRNWYLANCRVSDIGLEEIAKSLNSVLERIYLPSKKLIVLDCDNTLWGGIIGEDGIKSINLGEDGIGKAFLDFQKTLKGLFNSGILLTICSKNNEKDVMNVFENHKFMQIKKEDITNFKINWKEKSENIVKISKELNLGLDSFVYWDDNPFERQKVSKALPQVLTITPSDKVENWPDQLRTLNCFGKFNATDLDKKKTYQYKVRSQFVKGKEKATEELSYLKSIKLKAKKIDLNSSTLSRAVQMTQKTNQFNLRTKRYSKKDIENFGRNKKDIIFLTDLKDIFGNHGPVGLIIGKCLNKKIIFIDTFLISCRVFGRYLESWMLREIKITAKRKGYKEIYGEYIQTEKNVISKEVLKQHNFKKIDKKKSDKIFKDLKITGELYASSINNIKFPKAKLYD